LTRAHAIVKLSLPIDKEKGALGKSTVRARRIGIRQHGGPFSVVVCLTVTLGGCTQISMNESNSFQLTAQEVRATRAAEEWLLAQNILISPEPSGAAWPVAQGVLNGVGSDHENRGLYIALCNAGDRSACIMAAALAQTMR
jgi:hypothetical protein